jgi:hypothetical protein
MMFGVEGRGLSSFAKSTKEDVIGATQNISFPYWSGWCQSFCSNFCATNASAPQYPSGLTLQSGLSQINKIERTAAFDASFRVGADAGGVLLFGRLGAGAEAIRATRTTDTRATVTCNNPVSVVVPTGPDSGNAYVVGCGSLTGGTVTTTVANTIQPYMTVGLDVEKNFGQFFARVEGEILTHFMPVGFTGTNGVYYTTQVTAGLGYRF